MNNWYKIFRGVPRIARDVFLNIFWSKKYKMFYVVENAEWSILWDGRYITKNLNRFGLLKSKVITDHVGLRKKIIHFGSESTFISEAGLRRVHRSNKVVFTWFHISPDDKRVKYARELNRVVDVVHTSCEITKRKLIGLGVNEGKIIVVPLGVDLKVFKPESRERIRATKKDLGIDPTKIIIGSFQKDGVGWGYGKKPKLVKGPDVFCEAVERLAQKYDVHVLLAGPARGYVRDRLEKAGITYTHRYFKNYLDIACFYPLLDLYLITSREEGGPKSVLEAMASGVPVVSTRIGMVADIAGGGEFCYIADIDDARGLEQGVVKILENRKIRDEFVQKGLKVVKKYDWSSIAKRYYDEIYVKLL